MVVPPILQIDATDISVAEAGQLMQMVLDIREELKTDGQILTVRIKEQVYVGSPSEGN